MNYCRFCGKKLPRSDGRFCPYCGKNLIVEEIAPEVNILRDKVPTGNPSPEAHQLSGSVVKEEDDQEVILLGRHNALVTNFSEPELAGSNGEFSANDKSLEQTTSTDILELLSLEVNTLPALGYYLGVDQNVLVSSITGLLKNQYVEQRSPLPGEAEYELFLTPTGQDAVIKQGPLPVPTRKTGRFFFNALTESTVSSSEDAFKIISRKDKKVKTMTKIFTSGRTDLKDFFEKSGNFDGGKLLHTPFLAFVEQDDGIHVRIVDNAEQLLALPDETPVMGQWQGNYRSDFFQFVVGDYRPFADEKRKQWEQSLLSARNVIKNVGPQGGFRFLSFEYTAEGGYTTHHSVGTMAEASKLEEFFQQHNIPVIEKREEKSRRNR